MSISYPQIIIYNEEIEVIENTQDFQYFIHSMSATEQQKVAILNQVFEYKNINGESLTPLSANQLAQLVKEYLAKEGHCCLSKISSLTPEQAFNLVNLSCT